MKQMGVGLTPVPCHTGLRPARKEESETGEGVLAKVVRGVYRDKSVDAPMIRNDKSSPRVGGLVTPSSLFKVDPRPRTRTRNTRLSSTAMIARASPESAVRGPNKQTNERCG